MNQSLAMRASAALLIAAVTIGAAGCDNQSGIPQDANPPLSKSTPNASPTVPTAKPSATAAANPTDYMRLLIQPRDIATATDTFAAQSPATNPNGRAGAEVLLVNQNQTRGINVMILQLPEPGSAAAALEDAKASLSKSMASPNPQPSPVGTGGTVASGLSPDGSKQVTVLLFTEGPALARLEFDGLPGQPAPEPFVTDVGQKQAIALRVGLGS